MWAQNYDPFGNPVVSTLVATVPIAILLGGIALFRLKAHTAALLGFLSALAIAIFAFHMSAVMASTAAAFGAAYGLMPIGWIILNVMFMYRLTAESGQFRVLQESIAGITPDRRLQLLLIAFAFGSFFEGAAGFGTPVAVSGAMLIGLGFSPLAASGLSLIANTAPVAFGALGTPIIALANVTGLDLLELTGMVGRQLPFFSLIVPAWLVAVMSGSTRNRRTMAARGAVRVSSYSAGAVPRNGRSTSLRTTGVLVPARSSSTDSARTWSVPGERLRTVIEA